MDSKAPAPVAPLAGDSSARIMHGYKRNKPHPYYNYTGLPEGWIRLVQVHGDSMDAIDSALGNFNLYDDLHVTLHDYPLSSCPPYVALSYTWGEPTETIDPSYRILSQEPRSFPIHCGEKVLRATRNLRDALHHLRRCQRIRKNMNAFDISEGYAKRLQEHFRLAIHSDLYWIDALCIDQDDHIERST
ncbi:hypothetical protein GGR51DRAFT_342587 [Nemania sp. FL0031]|nr:hypothetical protein GGR51DRAFT_342587 [Nemania sp. FL0031]